MQIKIVKVCGDVSCFFDMQKSRSSFLKNGVTKCAKKRTERVQERGWRQPAGPHAGIQSLVPTAGLLRWANATEARSPVA